MPSDDDLARSISELKDEFRSGLSSLKRELAQEHDAALKKLKTATASVPKFKKKGNESQFLLNSEVSLNTSSLLRPPFRRLRLKLKRPSKS